MKIFSSSAVIGGVLSAAIGVFTAFWSTVSTAAGIVVTDDAGRRVELKAPAQRIITLAPFLTELAFSAGAGERLVGVSMHSDYPPEAAALPQVASAVTLSMEEVVALRPDLVLAWRDSIRMEDVERLARFGIATFVAQARALDDVARLLAAIGALAGRDVGAQVAGYRRALEALRRAHAGKPRLAAFVEIWHRPLMTLSGPHWINEALEICGAANAFADLPGIAPHVAWEDVYARDPPLVVGAGSARDAAQFRANWGARPTLAAVRGRRLVFVHADLIQRPTLRLAQGAAALCEGIDAVR